MRTKTGQNPSTAGALMQFLRNLISPGYTEAQLDAAFGTHAEMAVGEYAGTGAALDVALAFDPIFVLVYNLTDGDAMGFAFNTASVGTKSASIVLATAQEAAQGILFAAAGTKKFSLGTSAVLNENAKTYQYVAFGA